MASYLTFLNFTNLRKNYTVLDHTNPFIELEDEEFRRRFRVTKNTALLLLSEVSCYYTIIISSTQFLVQSTPRTRSFIKQNKSVIIYRHTSSGIPCVARTSPLLQKGCKHCKVITTAHN